MGSTRGLLLIVEDEPDLARLLSLHFAREGYRTAIAPDGIAALERARAEPPDAILLDLMLPRLDGLETLRRIRATSRVPVIILTAKAEETDRVVGLELGADDYVVKPFSTRELSARLEAVRRRTTAPAPESGARRAGALEVDLERHLVRVGGTAVELTAKEFGLLAALLKADGRVLGREALLESVWGYQRAGDLDTRTVDQHVARLRRKLKAEAARLETVKTAGYRLKTE